MDPKLEAAHEALTNKVMGSPGVVGTAIGEKGGKPCLKVYLTDSKAKSRIPGAVGGFPVVVEVTGPFRRL